MFKEVKYLYKRLRSAIISGQNLWDTMAIIIVLNSLDGDFDITTINIWEIGDKTIDQIQNIF